MTAKNLVGAAINVFQVILIHSHGANLEK